MTTFSEKFSARVFEQKVADPAARLAAYEARFDTRLPQRLREILIEMGGAVVFDRPVRFKPLEKTGWEGDDGALEISILFGPTDDKASLTRNKLMLVDQLPDGVSPFGEVGGGNMLCHGDSNERVFFWDHEAAPGARNLFLVAETFAAFEASLRLSQDQPPSEANGAVKVALRF